MPYNKAFLIPAAFDLLFFVKKLTVIGIIGKTHGVSKAAKPLKKEIMKISHIDFLGSGVFLTDIFFEGGIVSLTFSVSVFDVTVSTFFSDIVSFSTANLYPLTLRENGYSWGIKHFPASSQT